MSFSAVTLLISSINLCLSEKKRFSFSVSFLHMVMQNLYRSFRFLTTETKLKLELVLISFQKEQRHVPFLLLERKWHYMATEGKDKVRFSDLSVWKDRSSTSDFSVSGKELETKDQHSRDWLGTRHDTKVLGAIDYGLLLYLVSQLWMGSASRTWSELWRDAGKLPEAVLLSCITPAAPPACTARQEQRIILGTDHKIQHAKYQATEDFILNPLPCMPQTRFSHVPLAGVKFINPPVLVSQVLHVWYHTWPHLDSFNFF